MKEIVLTAENLYSRVCSIAKVRKMQIRSKYARNVLVWKIRSLEPQFSFSLNCGEAKTLRLVEDFLGPWKTLLQTYLRTDCKMHPVFINILIERVHHSNHFLLKFQIRPIW